MAAEAGRCRCGHPWRIHVWVSDAAHVVIDRYCTAPDCDAKCSPRSPGASPAPQPEEKGSTSR